MNTQSFSLCVASVAFLGVAFAGQTPKPADRGAKPDGATDERVIHVYRAEQIDGLELEGGNGKPVGKIDSLIIDSSDGRLAYAIIEQPQPAGQSTAAESKHIVPWPALEFAAPAEGAETLTVRTKLGKDQVTACPLYKPSEMIGAETERKAYEAAGLPMDLEHSRGVSARLVNAADLDGCSVRDKANDELGKIGRILVDPMEARVAYSVLDTASVLGIGEKHLALPWPVTALSFDKDMKAYFVVASTRELLATAPQYAEQDWKRMTSVAWIREIATYYKVEPYWVRPAPTGPEVSKTAR